MESEVDLDARRIMKETTKQKDGRYETGLLWYCKNIYFSPSREKDTSSISHIRKYAQNIDKY